MDNVIYRGLSFSQVQTLVEMERDILSFEGDLEPVRARCERANILLTRSHMLAWARLCEGSRRPGAAHAWYEAVAKDGNVQPLRAYLVRECHIEAVVEQFGEIKPAEARRIVRRYLKKARRNKSEHDVHYALREAKRAGDDTAVEELLAIAIDGFQIDNMMEARIHLMRPFTSVEVVAMHTSLTEEVVGAMTADKIVSFIIANFLDTLKRPFLNLVLGQRHRLDDVRSWARRLGVKLTVQDYKRLFATLRADDAFILWMHSMVEIVRHLGRRDPAWHARLPELYGQARDTSLNYGNIEEADAFGAQCGRPLTPDELRQWLRQFRNDDRDYYRDMIPVVERSLAKRIYEEVNGHPPPEEEAVA